MSDDDLMVDPGAGERAWIRQRPLRILVGVIALVGIVYWLIVRRGGGGGDEAAETPVVTATVEQVVLQPFAVTVSALGTVEPQPGAEARVAAPAATTVARIYVAEGQAVRTGDPLIQLDAAVFQARVKEAEIGREAAQRAYDRADRLVTQGILPRKDLEAANTDLARATADLTEARRIASLATLRSPIAGVVTSIDAAISQSVDVNQSLVQVVNPAALSVLFRLSPTQAAQVTRGADVVLSTPEQVSGTEPSGTLGTGKVAGISAALDSTSGGVEIRVVVPSSVRALKVGEEVSGRITLAVHANAVVVPLAALVPGDEGVHVFVVGPDDIAHLTAVEVGERSEKEAEILSGLKGGERVVVEGAYGVSDGARIQSEAEAAAAERESAADSAETPAP